MPKATDITGTFRVPEEAWGRFWNLLQTIPGADIMPNVRAAPPPPAKRTRGSVANGSSGKCIVLAALATPKTQLTGSQLAGILVKGGKSLSSVPNIIYELKKEKYITGTPAGFSMTAPGRAYFTEKCNIREE